MERKTNYGRVKGVVETVHGDKRVEKYLGIPYARPPLGKLRFEVSQWCVVLWEGVFCGGGVRCMYGYMVYGAVRCGGVGFCNTYILRGGECVGCGVVCVACMVCGVVGCGGFLYQMYAEVSVWGVLWCVGWPVVWRSGGWVLVQTDVGGGALWCVVVWGGFLYKCAWRCVVVWGGFLYKCAWRCVVVCAVVCGMWRVLVLACMEERVWCVEVSVILMWR